MTSSIEKEPHQVGQPHRLVAPDPPGAERAPSPDAEPGAEEATQIQVRDVTKVFGPKPRGKALELLRAGSTKEEILRETDHVVGLQDVSFDVKVGEVFVVMGLSGSGKSTLIRCLNRLVEPTTGSVEVNGEDITQVSSSRLQEIRRTKISMVFQHFGLFPHKNVLENVAYGLKVQRTPERDRFAAAAEALDLVGLAEWGKSMPDELSGGMQQRVGLARALATDPDILLMDEAFSALDPLIRRQMQNEMLQLQERVQKTIVFITHDLNEALRVGNRVAIMQDGAIVQVGEPAEIITNPQSQYVADFIQDVDQGRVLGVSEVTCEQPPVVPAGRTTVAQALERIRTSDDEALYVVGPDDKVIGLVTAAELTGRDADADVSEKVQADYPSTPGDATIADTYAACAQGLPVAVEGEDGRLEGVVHPLEVLDKLGLIERIAEDTSFDDAAPTVDTTREAV